MDDFLNRLKQIQGEDSVSAFARRIGVPQKTLDHLVKGERKPSVEVVLAISRSCNVSSDWLLGMSPFAGGSPESDWKTRALSAERKLDRVNAAMSHILKGFEELQEAIK